MLDSTVHLGRRFLLKLELCWENVLVYLLLANDIPSLELCVPFNCLKFTLLK